MDDDTNIKSLQEFGPLGPELESSLYLIHRYVSDYYTMFLVKIRGRSYDFASDSGAFGRSWRDRRETSTSLRTWLQNQYSGKPRKKEPCYAGVEVVHDLRRAACVLKTEVGVGRRPCRIIRIVDELYVLGVLFDTGEPHRGKTKIASPFP